MQAPLNCKAWPLEPFLDPLPGQEACLQSFHDAGYLPFTGSGSLIGAATSDRCVCIVHRGRLIYWEFDLVLNGEIVKSVFTCNLQATKDTAVLWLSGEELVLALDPVGQYIVERPGMKPHINCD
jgi:hypothetical protein